MTLDATLLDILVCPEDKQPLWYFDDDEVLYNPRLKRCYRIKDNIPILLVDKGEDATSDKVTAFQKRFDAGDVRVTGEP